MDRFDWGSWDGEEEREWGCASSAAVEEERAPSLPNLMLLFSSVQN